MTAHSHDEEHSHDHHGGHGTSHGHGHSHGRIDPSITATDRGIHAVTLSFVILFAAAVIQLAVVWYTHSIGLLADTIHNFGDAGTAIPLGIAFVFSKRKPTDRFNYGYGRFEDFAGIIVVLIILASAVVAAYQSIERLLHPVAVSHLAALSVASIVGFAANEVVAVFRIRTGKEIGSAALVADGYHARTDGWTSLAVLFGALGVYLGYPIADPIIGLLITIAILGIVWQSARDVFLRALDGVEPGLIKEIRHTAQHVQGVADVTDVRARWSGHQLFVELRIKVPPEMPAREAQKITAAVQQHLAQAMTSVGRVIIQVDILSEQ